MGWSLSLWHVQSQVPLHRPDPIGFWGLIDINPRAAQVWGLGLVRMIMEGQYQFSSPEWDDRSDTVKDLVSWGCEWAGREAQELLLMLWGFP